MTPTINLTTEIWKEKYRDGMEASVEDTHRRVVYAVMGNDTYVNLALDSLNKKLWCPGGRILAGAGTKKRVTLLNCYVNETIHDSMEGIMHGLNVAAFSQQMGGGIGSDFSSIRPKGAIVHRTGSVSSGILPFMDMFHSMCSTVKSSGSRRGAMMGTLACWHPDIIDFIHAKNEKGRLTNFNVSVLVTDAFMQAVEDDSEWELGFNSEPNFSCTTKAIPDHIAFWKQRNQKHPLASTNWHVYKTIRARELWNMILRNTYEHAEPGVLFIDSINAWNNLDYCEYIHCTNPCGEQPLPPNGDCNLAALNLARLVENPFTSNAKICYEKIAQTAKVVVRFLDHVLDVAKFPTDDQREEALAKRRVGLGITGLGNLLQQCQIRYGSDKAVETTRSIMSVIRDAAYESSCQLAIEFGPFPAFSNEFRKRPFIQKLPWDIQQKIACSTGIRNGVLLTIAPTGTTSIYLDNISSGIEPTFLPAYDRKILLPDNSFGTFTVEDYGFKLYKEAFPDQSYKDVDYMVTANDLTVDEHLRMQAACQEYVDASISKTINCSKDMSFDEFKAVYSQAYMLGLKGCTTYRPSETRGAVLSAPKETVKPAFIQVGDKTVPEVIERLHKLPSTTYKVRWPRADQAFYVTISDHEINGRKVPFEIFINSKSVQHHEWITALTRCISAIFRRGGDVVFIVEELTQVFSAAGGSFMEGSYVPSLVALIGRTIEEHFVSIGLIQAKPKQESYPEGYVKTEKPPINVLGDICPKCGSPTLFKQEGCEKCSCGYSSC